MEATILRPRKKNAYLYRPLCPVLATVLVLTLGTATGCKKKQTPGNGTRSAAADTSYLPQDVFGPPAVPGARVLKPIARRSLSESELKYGIAPRRSSTVEYQPDVIVMERGDNAIRSIVSDGMESQFDANAPHVREFQQGRDRTRPGF
jgi:hypothetical protein